MKGDIKTFSNTQQALFEEMVISDEWDLPEQKKEVAQNPQMLKLLSIQTLKKILKRLPPQLLYEATIFNDSKVFFCLKSLIISDNRFVPPDFFYRERKQPK